MVSRTTNIVMGIIGTVMLAIFIVGLAQSISTGFAGFWGGLPFWVISILVLAMAGYEFWRECLRR